MHDQLAIEHCWTMNISYSLDLSRVGGDQKMYNFKSGLNGGILCYHIILWIRTRVENKTTFLRLELKFFGQIYFDCHTN